MPVKSLRQPPTGKSPGDLYNKITGGNASSNQSILQKKRNLRANAAKRRMLKSANTERQPQK